MSNIKLNNLSKYYGSKCALNNVSIELLPGKIYGLCGNNGAGKSTLIRILCGVDIDYSGNITIDNIPLNYEHKKIISYYADASFFHDALKVCELFDLFTQFFPDFDSKKCESLVYRNDILPDTTLGSLSKGTRIKTELAFILSRDAQIYVFDEPFASLDPLTREEIIQLIVTGGNENSTYLIATHLINDIETYLDNVVLLKNGHLMFNESVEKIHLNHECSVQDYIKQCLKER